MASSRALCASVLLVAAWAFASACTVNTGSTAAPCRVDAAVACTGNFVGYSCTGASTPSQADSSLTCGAGVAEADAETGFCCAVEASSSCSVDDAAGCTNGSTGYSCTGVETPTSSDPALACGAGVSATSGNTLYCCVTATASSSCAPDSSVAGCTGGSYGFSCTSTDTPSDGNAALTCSTPVAGDNGSAQYCCVGFSQGTSSCSPDSSVVGCTAGSFGFSCTSTDTPDQTQSSLTCSTPAQGPNSELLYCCSTH